VVAHEHIGVQPPAGARADLAERLQKALPIRIVAENRLAPIPAIKHMAEYSREFNSRLSSKRQVSDSKTDPIRFDWLTESRHC